MTERSPILGLGLEASTIGTLVTFLRHEKSDSIRFLAVHDWVSIQLAQAEENRALFLRYSQAAIRAREQINEIDARMSHMEADPEHGLAYFNSYRAFEEKVFKNVLRDAQKAVPPTGREVLTVVTRRIWAAQQVFQAYPRLRRARK